MPPSSDEQIGPLTARGWAWGVTLVLALSIADDLLRIPVQVFDALEEILAAFRSPSAVASFWSATFNAAYLRPFRIAQIKLLFDLAHGHYWLVYRGFHALLLIVCLLLFTRALRVRTRTDLVAAVFALAVLVGLHTFRTTIQEAFPINHFLEIAVCALAALNLAQSRGGLWVDGAALLVFAAAALTLESGLLVWVVVAAAWATGLRGVSTRGLVLMTGLVAAYMYLRFVSLSVGVPGLVERASGYGFQMLDPPELAARFGGSKVWGFRLYNIVASLLSVLFSEPQAGVFLATRAWIEGHAPERHLVAVISSCITTGLLGAVTLAWVRRREPWDDAMRLVPVFAAVLCASAAISFAYTKDDIMSTAGMFYALAVYAAVRALLQHLPRASKAGTAAVVVLLCVAGTGWTVRTMGIHHIARSAAFKTRNDWAFQPGQWRRQGRWPARLDEQRLLQHLRSEALAMKVPNPRFQPSWMDDWWGN